MTPVSPPVEAVPDEVRELVRAYLQDQVDRGLRIGWGRKGEDWMCAGVQLERIRAIRPASPPRADAGEVEPCGYLKASGHWTVQPIYVDAATWNNHPWMQKVFTIPVFGTLATQPAEAVRASQEERDRIAEDERDRLFERVVESGKFFVPAHEHGIRIFLSNEGAMLPADRAAARQAHRDQRGGDGV